MCAVAPVSHVARTQKRLIKLIITILYLFMEQNHRFTELNGFGTKSEVMTVFIDQLT